MKKVKALIAIGVIATYCALVVLGKTPVEGFGIMVMYIVKKYFDERSKPDVE